MGIKAVKVGMYHSHPGLKVFMSPIDVGQNREGQVYGDEHVSIVIDPIESVATGRLEIGAFRRCAQRRLHSNPACILTTSIASYIIQDMVKNIGPPSVPPQPQEEPVDTFGADRLEEIQGSTVVISCCIRHSPPILRAF